MTRDNRDKSKGIRSPSVISAVESIVGLPDLSNYRDDEKQHILHVLERDENLRNQHLSRFLTLRKEVADLEQHSQQTSTSVCARCQTPFGYIFNTGDACPKCGAKVCKQCRLMYNVHDNGWLCQLCCKQMQLMSYSGEWVYSNRSNLRKHSISSSASQYKSFPHSPSARMSNFLSSSDSEPELVDPLANTFDRFNKPVRKKPVKSKRCHQNNRMIVQNEIDEEKLSFIKDHIKKRPLNMSYTQPLPRRVQHLTPTSYTMNSSTEDVNSVFNQTHNHQDRTSTKENPTHGRQDLTLKRENPTTSRQDITIKKENRPMTKDIEALRADTNENQSIVSNREEIDRKSEASSEMTDYVKKPKRQRLKERLSRQTSAHGSKLSLESTTTTKSTHKHLSVSMQNLRDTVRRISPSHILSSRTSENLENTHRPAISSTSTFNDEDITSIKIPDIHKTSNNRAKSQILQPTINEAKESPDINRQQSSSATISTARIESQSKENLPSSTLSKTTAKIESQSKENPSSSTLSRTTAKVESQPKENISSSKLSIATTTMESQPKENLPSATLSKTTAKIEPQSKANVSSSKLTTATTTMESNRENRSKSVENHENVRTNRTTSVGNRASNADSDEDIDNTFKKAKMGTSKRASSFLDIRGSQLSLNSVLSESKAQYELDITGTISLRLSYHANKSSLEIFIEKCTNLARAKRNQTSNPYCKTYLLPDPSKASKLKTTTKKHTTDPTFGETLRYQLSSQDFNSRIIWISVWNQSALGHNDFLGEIHIPLANCTLDSIEEYTLLPRIQKEDAISNIEPAGNSSELHFELTFVENPKSKELGTIQINTIQGKDIYYGKQNVDAICKGLLMPDKIKRKLPTTRKGPLPKWDVPLRWENIRRKNLRNTSLEISIWCQERFRKSMIGCIRLSVPQEQTDGKASKWLDATNEERSVWESFLKDPTKVHRCQLPLRPGTQEK